MRILCIDGGGIRGLIPAIVLAEIEERTGRPVCELFDFVAGTSTGGILACALTKPAVPGKRAPAHTAAGLAALYETEGPRIFHRSLRKQIFSIGGLVDERYDDDGLNAALERYLGDTRIKEALTRIFITAYDIKDRFAFFFRSARARRDATYDFSMVQAARATSAAPTYFEPIEVTDAAGARTYPLIDGGVYAVNPSMCAVAEHRGKDIDVLVSLGTGSQTRAYSIADARRWGQLEWARPALDMVFDGVSDTIEFEASKLLPRGAFVRLQTPLAAARDDLDDASPENLARLREDAETLLREDKRRIRELCKRLTA